MSTATVIEPVRELEAIDAKTSKTPFLYEGNVLGTLREDQIPRFFGALTDTEKLPTKKVKLADLTAMQNRVLTAKVKAIRGSDDTGGKKPLVVKHQEQLWIADGHHRMTAMWLDGEEETTVHFKDISPMTNAVKSLADGENQARIVKVDETHGIVFGWAIVCKIDGEDYYDLNVDRHTGKRVPEHVPEDAMLKATVDFMMGPRAGNEMHSGPDKGTFVFAWPMTSEIAKAMGITTEKTGLMVAYKPPADVLGKFVDGTYTGFSIEGARLSTQEID